MITNDDKDVEKFELLYLATGNVKWFRNFAKESAVPQEVKIIMTW